MAEYSFEEEMRTAVRAVKEMRDSTDDEWFLCRLRLVSGALEILQELYAISSRNVLYG